MLIFLIFVFGLFLTVCDLSRVNVSRVKKGANGVFFFFYLFALAMSIFPSFHIKHDIMEVDVFDAKKKVGAAWALFIRLL